MGFALKVEETLRHRETQALEEFARGDPLEAVLTRYLLAVESAAGTDMLTSVLLLKDNELRHGAAPSLAPAYCSAIDGAKIGPSAGSCGTAAYLGHPIYVTDIANDPLWNDYRAVALEHGLRACWSTPIRDEQGAILGTFAIYHLTPRSPTQGEVEAIRTITDHVARAIMLSNRSLKRTARKPGTPRPALYLVSDNKHHPLGDIEADFEAIAQAIERRISELAEHGAESDEVDKLQRAKETALRGAALARNARPSGTA